MSSTLAVPTRFAPIADAIDVDLPPLSDAVRALVDCRANDEPVPAQLLNSVRAYRLASLADAIERYNDRLTGRRVVSA